MQIAVLDRANRVKPIKEIYFKAYYIVSSLNRDTGISNIMCQISKYSQPLIVID